MSEGVCRLTSQISESRTHYVDDEQFTFYEGNPEIVKVDILPTL